MACGSLGAGPASDNVPNAGVTGWRMLGQRPGTAIREPYVLCEDEGVRSPSTLALGLEDYRMWYVDAQGTLRNSTSTDGIYDFGPGSPVTLPEVGPWAEVGVGHDGESFLMAVSAASGTRIAFFGSSDGTAWTSLGQLDPAQAWEDGRLGGPDVLFDPLLQRWVLYYDANSRRAIGRAESPDGVAWTRGAAPLFTASEVYEATGWPVLEIGSPAAGLDTSRPGPPVYKIWFAGLELHGAYPFVRESSIGFAGSFDGLSWEQYPLNPVLAQVELPPGKPLTFSDEAAPSVLHLPGDEYFMYIQQPFLDSVTGESRPCVALALTP